MSSTLRSRLESSRPAVPQTSGHLAWILARARQILKIIGENGEVKVGELWVQLHPDTLARVGAECKDLIADPLPGVSALAQITVEGQELVMYLISDENLDKTTSSISLGDTDSDVEIAASAILGFVYPFPLPVAEVEIRWVLQHDDGMDSVNADKISNIL